MASVDYAACTPAELTKAKALFLEVKVAYLSGRGKHYGGAWPHGPPKVAVDNAGPKGRGLFAAADCEPGEILALMPCHLFVAERGGRYAGRPAVHEFKLLEADPNDYTIDVTTLPGVVQVAGCPAATQFPGVAHMANDAAKPDYSRCRTLEDYYRVGLEYEAAAYERANAMFLTKDTPILLKATRPIRRGEEIFTPYGAAYWLPYEIRSAHHGNFAEKMVKWGGKHLPAVLRKMVGATRGEVWKNG